MTNLTDYFKKVSLGPEYLGPFQVYDYFEEPDGTLLSAHAPTINIAGNPWVNWQYDSPYDNGIFTINSKSAGVVESNAIAQAIIDTTISDISLEVNVTMGNNGLHGSQGIIFRFIDTANYWIITKDGGSNIVLSEVLADVSTQRDTFAAGISANITYAFKLEAIGSIVVGYLDDVEVLRYESATVHQFATAHGIQGIAISGSITRFRNFSVSANP
jgi:hypothetical protein